MKIKSDDGTVLNIRDVAVRQAAERTYLINFDDPEYGAMKGIVSSICLEDPNRLQDAKGYIAQYVLSDNHRFPYNSYPRLDALYRVVAGREAS